MFALTKIDNTIHCGRGRSWRRRRQLRLHLSTIAADLLRRGPGLPPSTVCGPAIGSYCSLRGINASCSSRARLKLHYRALTVEFEGTSVLGRMDHGGILLAPAEELDRATFRQFGGVLASELHLYRDAFFVGFEVGGASGDQAENPSQYLNYRWRFVRQPAGDTARATSSSRRISRRFDPVSHIGARSHSSTQAAIGRFYLQQVARSGGQLLLQPGAGARVDDRNDLGYG